jgi:hypothetical protein
MKCAFCEGPLNTRAGMWLHPRDDDEHPGYPMCHKCLDDYNARHPDKQLRCECCEGVEP